MNKLRLLTLLCLIAAGCSSGDDGGDRVEASLCDPVREGTPGTCNTVTTCVLYGGCETVQYCSGGTNTEYSDACELAIRLNRPPAADAGTDVFAAVEVETVLDSSGSSDPEGAALTTSWFFYAAPPSSRPGLTWDNSANQPAAGFTADKYGSYVLELGVYDQFTGFDTDLLRVIVQSDTSPGQFSGTATGLDLSIVPEVVVRGDFNADNRTDLIVASYDPTDNYQVLLGDGAGGFVPDAPFSGPVPCEERFDRDCLGAAGHFNNDSNLDFIVTGQGEMFLMAGNGLGQFSASVISEDLRQTSVGDFNGDSVLDIIGLTFPLPAELVILLGDGTGGFTERALAPVGYFPDIDKRTYAVADVNRDSISDILYISKVTNLRRYAGSGTPGVAVEDIQDNGSVSVLLGMNTGDFFALGARTATPDLRYLGVGDFDNDGNVDFAGPSRGIPYGREERVGSPGSPITRFVTEEVLLPNISVYLGDGRGTFTRSELAGIPATPLFMEFGENLMGDFNGDSYLDVLVYHPVGSTNGYISIYYGDGSGQLPRMKLDKIVDTSDGARLTEMFVFDVNSDNKDDIVFTLHDQSRLYVSLAN